MSRRLTGAGLRHEISANLCSSLFGLRSDMFFAWMLAASILMCWTCVLSEASPLPTMRQQHDFDLDRYLTDIATTTGDDDSEAIVIEPRYPELSAIGIQNAFQWRPITRMAKLPPVKKNYQYIWRNVQMRMPHYRTTDSESSASKRAASSSSEVLRHRANTLYRLGK
ncbi:hypothetical protein DdX_19601 [Ditylenchus destructor]|uniref:Uncharacterized protein n=1 Tax=Ditylenchus destructor TaxID=166010 RepID=A0AAD4QS89_9BILA|nr:hypothetical protein DdX_19601 [Ditylenchus destructor]